jgi:hypothetical protein
MKQNLKYSIPEERILKLKTEDPYFCTLKFFNTNTKTSDVKLYVECVTTCRILTKVCLYDGSKITKKIINLHVNTF